MAHYFVILFLILIHTFLLILAAASSVIDQPTQVKSPALISPSNHTTNIQTAAEAPAPKSRKLGKHDDHVNSGSEPPAATGPLRDHEENHHGGSTTAEKQHDDGRHQHHHQHGIGSGSVDKSIAGGAVILGGLIIAFVVTIAWYIRATRRTSMVGPVEPPTPTHQLFHHRNQDLGDKH